MVRQFGRLLSPGLTNVRTDWGGSTVKAATSSLPPIFSGDRLLAYALANGVTSSVVRLSADTPAGPLSVETALDPSRATRGQTVGTLAARARIRELEESPEWLSSRGSRQSQRKESRVAQEIIALALKHGLVSRETSFVAIERRATPVLGGLQLRRVPIAITTGWGGFDPRGSSHGRFMAQRASLGDASMMASFAPGHATPPSRFQARLGSIGQTLLGAPGDGAAAHSSRGDAVQTQPMLALVALQRADGSWELTRELADAIGRDLTDLEAAVRAATGNREDIRRAWATSLAIAWLEARAPDARNEWRLLAIKARQWLDRVPAQPPGGGPWIEAAEAVLHEATA